ncbi:MAG TPA: hypothetical protein VKE40_28545 [Gemmataceae bacterium]|nr:hypothetical protein [Gemmataceae bacterium]
MTVTVIVMPTAASDRYTARLGAPHNFQTEAATADAAFAALEAQFRAKVPAGTDLVRVDVPAYDRLFEVVGGLAPDSPEWGAWAAEVEAYRRQRDAEDAAHVASERGA